MEMLQPFIHAKIYSANIATSYTHDGITLITINMPARLTPLWGWAVLLMCHWTSHCRGIQPQMRMSVLTHQH